MKNYLVFCPEEDKEMMLGVAMGYEWFSAHEDRSLKKMLTIIDPKDNSDPYFAKDPVRMIHKDTQTPADTALEESSFSRVVLPYSPLIFQKYPVLFTDLFQKLSREDSLPFFQLTCSSATIQRLEEEAVLEGIHPNSPEFYCFWRTSFICEIARNALGEAASFVFQEKLFAEREKHSAPFDVYWGAIDSEESMKEAFTDIVKTLHKLVENRKKKLN